MKKTLSISAQPTISSTLFQRVESAVLAYVIQFGEKVENDTLKLRDCIFPFLTGCLISWFIYMVFGW